MRCEQHDLAAGPDGQCVVCHRERRSAAPASTTTTNATRAIYIGGAGILLAVAAVGVAYRAVRDRAIVAQAEAMTARPSTPNANAGPLTPKQQALASVNIVVYTTQWCPVCKRAKTWLRANDIPFEERDVEASRQWGDELRARNPRGSIPTFDVEGEIAIGFSESGVLAMRENAAARKMPK